MQYTFFTKDYPQIHCNMHIVTFAQSNMLCIILCTLLNSKLTETPTLITFVYDNKLTQHIYIVYFEK